MGSFRCAARVCEESSKVLVQDWMKLAPRARFELATLRLTAECSTVELSGIRTVES